MTFNNELRERIAEQFCEDGHGIVVLGNKQKLTSAILSELEPGDRIVTITGDEYRPATTIFTLVQATETEFVYKSGKDVYRLPRVVQPAVNRTELYRSLQGSQRAKTVHA